MRLGGLLAGAALALGSIVPDAAWADDQPFLTLDATDIEPELGHELEQNFTWTSGLHHQSFNGIEGETELEYGLSDQIQIAGSAEYEWSRARPHAPNGPAESDTEFEGIAGEVIWQAMNVYFDPMGLGFLLSPSVGRDERGIEAKALLQKNFINDRLRAVINAGVSFGQARDGHDWEDESAVTLDAGLAYNITWAWSLAAEFNYERNFGGALIDGRAVPQRDTFYLGPTLQYVAHPWTASLGVQEQLPWAHDLTRTPGALYNGLNTDSERFRVALRVTRDFF